MSRYLVEGQGLVGFQIRVIIRAQAENAIKAVRPQFDGLAPLEGYAIGGRFAAAILDMNFTAGARDGSEGLRAVEIIRRKDPNLAIIALTVHGGVALAVGALQRGACDFLLKPWRNARLVESLQAAAGLTASQRASETLSLEEIERQAIARVLERHDGNISKAAVTLGLTRPALYRRIEKYGL